MDLDGPFGAEATIVEAGFFHPDALVFAFLRALRALRVLRGSASI
jgi:hypothetical protein